MPLQANVQDAPPQDEEEMYQHLMDQTAETLLISSIHIRIVSALKFPIDSFCSAYFLHGLLSAFEVSLCRLIADKARPR